MTPREANIFACLVDTVVAPAPPLPAVGRTDAVEAFGRYLQRSPRAGRVGLRAALFALELGPLVAGAGGRLRRLDRAQRERFLGRLAASSLSPLLNALRGVAQLSYYGDQEVMRLLGYDAAERVARGRRLRVQEARW